MSHIVELHLHLDGSLRPETVWELAKEQGVEPVSYTHLTLPTKA